MSAQDPSGGAGRQPTEEEMRAALEEELKRVRVEQVVTEATVSILNVAVLRAGLVPGSEGERDLAQTRVGIEAVRALLPLVEQALGVEQARPIRDALTQLQMAYVRAVSAAPADAGESAPDASGAPSRAGAAEQPPAAGAAPRPGDPGPAQRSGRLWVPGQ
jgi:hypothetical protein